jgi:Phage derived protein Gp49-like (DUF891)/Helix-turn-helix domain
MAGCSKSTARRCDFLIPPELWDRGTIILRELRIQHEGRPYRVLYAFDPRRSAVLLIGGDKTGKGRWYEEHVPIAERIYDEHVAKLIAEYALDELREARSMTQARLADIPGKDQSVISRIEKRTDMYVGTLAEFIRAMGGELEIRAVFPEGSVRIRRFGDIAG